MTYFSTFSPPSDGGAGFSVVAGRAQGLRRLLLAGGRLPPGDLGPVHLHAGDEVLRVLEGELSVRVADERRTCGPGDVIVVPPNTLHAFEVVTETLLEVVAELDIGTWYPIVGDDGRRRLVEISRPDLPWSAAGTWTSDEELAVIMGAIDPEA